MAVPGLHYDVPVLSLEMSARLKHSLPSNRAATALATGSAAPVVEGLMYLGDEVLNQQEDLHSHTS